MQEISGKILNLSSDVSPSGISNLIHNVRSFDSSRFNRMNFEHVRRIRLRMYLQSTSCHAAIRLSEKILCINMKMLFNA